MSKPNTTQRSWDNYVGDNPIESRKKKGFYSESPRHSLSGDEDYVPEGYERDPVTKMLKKRRVIRRTIDKNALERGLDEVKKSKRVEGDDEDEDTYTA